MTLQSHRDGAFYSKSVSSGGSQREGVLDNTVAQKSVPNCFRRIARYQQTAVFGVKPFRWLLPDNGKLCDTALAEAGRT